MHFEVDWDPQDGNGYSEHEARNADGKKKVHKLGIGLGPTGKATPMVMSFMFEPLLWLTLLTAATAMD